MDVGDTFVFMFSIVDGMCLLFLTVYFVSLVIVSARIPAVESVLFISTVSFIDLKLVLFQAELTNLTYLTA